MPEAQPIELSSAGGADRRNPDRLGTDERVRLMRDGVFNNASLLISGLIGIVLVPIMLRGLGVESYGLWIAALSVVGTVGLFDFGLGLSVTREVAASLGNAGGSESAPFIKAAGTIFSLFGIGGCILIATLGLPLSSGLHLSAASRHIAPTAFALAGVAFLADRLLAFTSGVLRGLRRFDITNLLVIIAALFRAAGIIVVIKVGSGVVAVMMWQVLATAAAALAGQWVIGKLDRKFRYHVGRFDWKLVRSHLPFGLASQLTTIVEVMIWEMVPLVVGMVLGSRWVAPYYIAQQFPMAVGPIMWTAADALFPAVSQHQREQDMAKTREILEVGTRWIVVVALPLCMGLWIVAPRLLLAWVGNVPPGSTLILRLTTATVFLEGVAAASIQVLWGRGAMRTLVIIPCCLTVSSLGLTLLLLPRMGFVGAAWGLVAPMFLASLIYIHIGAQTCGIRVWEVIRTASAGLLLPVLAFLVICLSINSLAGLGWAGVVAATVGGGLGYLICFISSGAREEELVLVRKVIDVPRTAGHLMYKRLRHLLARVGFLRSGYYLLLAVRDALMDSPARGQAELNHEFEPREDPWDYATVSYQRERIRSEVAMLDAARGAVRFGQALEVGCAEGIFTEILAPLCESLLAVDISQVALGRARRRLSANQHVRFAEWDLRVDPLPDTYDVIIMIHALEYIRNPFYVRSARTKLVNGLRPGGYLLLGTMRTDETTENAWWNRYLLRSGKRINNFFADHPALSVVKTAEFYLGKDYIAYDVLLRKATR
ncbi:MAG: SAM-dependent methyltransferase [Acidobacteriota bacterium]|nr:SAM-dependent methyltransferase [Acidobacteriota bacterium]